LLDSAKYAWEGHPATSAFATPSIIYHNIHYAHYT
jgi:hypothetical protein